MKKIEWRGILGYSLLLLFLSYLGSIVCCYHVSIVEGRLVAHAHVIPETEGADAEAHTHTMEELLQLDQLSHIQVGGSILSLYDLEPVSHLAGNSFSIIREDVRMSERVVCGLRAPPLYLS